MSELGEKAFIARLAEDLDAYPFSSHLDDAAAISIPRAARFVALSADRGPASVARALGLAGTESDGRLAAIATISDLLAAGANPSSAVLAMSAPMDSDVEELLAAARAFAQTCDQYSVSYVGGDTKRGPWRLVSSGIGFSERPLLRRRAGRPGDLIVITGRVGDFATSLMCLTYGLDFLGHEQIVANLSKPTIALSEALWARKQLDIRSSTDASDGVFEAISNLLPEGAGAAIDEASIPLSQVALEVCEATGIHPTALLSAAGDWNQVMAVSPESVNAKWVESDMHIGIIGRIVPAEGIVSLDPTGKSRRLDGLVSDHFRTRFEDHSEYFAALSRLRQEM